MRGSHQGSLHKANVNAALNALTGVLQALLNSGPFLPPYAFAVARLERQGSLNGRQMRSHLESTSRCDAQKERGRSVNAVAIVTPLQLTGS